jgi:hypothetical protein
MLLNAFRPILAALLLLGPTLASAQQAPQISIASAHLFNARTGQMSPDVFQNADAWSNTPAGPFASTATFVVVRVDFGARQPVPVGARVALVATDVRRVGRKLLRRIVSSSSAMIGPASSDGTTHVGFWLSDTGCRPITLTMTLFGANTISMLAKGRGELPFACYE